jgi:hypothetical protein
VYSTPSLPPPPSAKTPPPGPRGTVVEGDKEKVKRVDSTASCANTILTEAEKSKNRMTFFILPPEIVSRFVPGEILNGKNL